MTPQTQRDMPGDPDVDREYLRRERRQGEDGRAEFTASRICERSTQTVLLDQPSQVQAMHRQFPSRTTTSWMPRFRQSVSRGLIADRVLAPTRVSRRNGCGADALTEPIIV